MPKDSYKVMPPLDGDEPVFSQAQVDWVVTQVETAADRAATRVRNRSLIGFLILLFGIMLTFYVDNQGRQDARNSIVTSGNAVAVHACNQDFKLIDVFRVEVQRSVERLEKLPPSPDTTQRLEASQRFLDSYTLPDCRDARIVTTDPAAVKAPPSPHFPGDGTALSEGNAPQEE